MPILLLLLLLFAHAVAARADEVPLALKAAGHHDVEVTRPDDASWQITATGTDPWVGSVPMAAAIDLSRTPILTFEYISITGIDDLQVFIGEPWSEESSVHAGAMAPRQGWSEISIELAQPKAIRQLRLDFGDRAGAVVQVRKLRLRPRNAQEGDAAAREARRVAGELELAAALRSYLQHPYASQLERIVVASDTVEISGTAAGDGVSLAEWPLWMPLISPLHLGTLYDLHAGTAGAFRLSLPRRSQGLDRALSRWVLVRRSPGGDELVSHARWSDAVPAASSLPEMVPRSKKGLGGFHAGMRDSDLDELGIAAVTVNISLAQLLKADASAGTFDAVHQERTWHFSRDAVAHLDATMLAAAKRGIVVLAIILVDKAQNWASPELGRIFQHPDYRAPGVFSMPNVTSAEGVAGYAAMMDFLAERYGRADGLYGRIHHWIIGNEVDMGWDWTNCGQRPELVYIDQYYKALRIAFCQARRYDPHARVYISLTQWWNQTGDAAHCYPAHALLDDLSALSTAEGDFDWGVAYHPYPDSLFEPKSWLDKSALFASDSPKITFRNIEVLEAWAQAPRNRYLGRTVRSIHLSEQGPNSRDYTPQALAEQAASMAYVWKKISVLPSIESFEYHNWVDNRGEGGLRIGLRRFPDDAQEPFGAKPVWQVYRALGTKDEDAACAFALPIIGIATWDEVLQRSLVDAPRR